MRIAEPTQGDLEQVLYRLMLEAYAGTSKKRLMDYMRYDFEPDQLARMERMSREEVAEIYCRDAAARIAAKGVGAGAERQDGETNLAADG